MTMPDRIQQFLQRLTPLTRSSLLTELERLEACDGAAESASAAAATIIDTFAALEQASGERHAEE